MNSVRLSGTLLSLDDVAEREEHLLEIWKQELGKDQRTVYLTAAGLAELFTEETVWYARGVSENELRFVQYRRVHIHDERVVYESLTEHQARQDEFHLLGKLNAILQREIEKRVIFYVTHHLAKAHYGI